EASDERRERGLVSLTDGGRCPCRRRRRLEIFFRTVCGCAPGGREQCRGDAASPYGRQRPEEIPARDFRRRLAPRPAEQAHRAIGERAIEPSRDLISDLWQACESERLKGRAKSGRMALVSPRVDEGPIEPRETRRHVDRRSGRGGQGVTRTRWLDG